MVVRVGASFRKGVEMKSVKSLDKTALVNLYNIGGKDFLLKMIDNFMAQSPNRIKSAHASLATGDLKAIHLIAHSLKASSANLGAAKVHDLAEKLEEMASVGLKEHIGEALDRIEDVLNEAIGSLKAERELWGTPEPKAPGKPGAA
jgi:HPt (histidine-containing phosphotransfer) domain-containing protein